MPCEVQGHRAWTAQKGDVDLSRTLTGLVYRLDPGKCHPAGIDFYSVGVEIDAREVHPTPARTSARSASTGSIRGRRELFVIEIAAHHTASTTRSSTIAGRVEFDLHVVDDVVRASASLPPRSSNRAAASDDGAENNPGPGIHCDHLLGVHLRHTLALRHRQAQNSPIAIPNRR